MSYHISPGTKKHKIEQPAFTPQHEELINFVHNSWKQINQEFLNQINNGEKELIKQITYYKEPADLPPDFQPFDLEAFYLQRIHKTDHQQTSTTSSATASSSCSPTTSQTQSTTSSPPSTSSRSSNATVPNTGTAST